jgi:hypothetical protein
VNFLAHAWILPDTTPELVLGSALPDLVRMFDRRAPRLATDAARTLESAGARELARGVLAHHAADVSFHGSAAFREGCASLRPVARAVGEAGGRVRGFFLAHVLLELLLDAALLEREPGLVARLDAALAPSVVGRALAPLERAGVAGVGFDAFVTRWRAARVVADYATDRGLAHRLVQVLARARQPVSFEAERAIAESVGPFRGVVRASVEALTREPRARVLEALGDSGA